MPHCSQLAPDRRNACNILFVCGAAWPRSMVSYNNTICMVAKRGGKKRKRARQAKRGASISRGVSVPQEKVDANSSPLPSSVDAAVDPNAEKTVEVPSVNEISDPSRADEVVSDVAPEVEVLPDSSDPSVSNASAVPSVADAEADVPNDMSELPVPDESIFKLPEQPGGARGVRKRRRMRGANAAKAAAAAGEDADTGAPLPEAEISRLTAAYRTGAKGRDELVERIERDPDYMFRSGNAKGEYGLAAAIIGTGSPNKQGVYVLPYLQSSHVILLGVILLGTFVYYPGFPLTEGSEELRSILKKALAFVFTLNLALAVYSYAEAKKRAQPPLFWFFKVALLGNIALQELRGNASVDEKSMAKSKRTVKKK